MKRIYWICLILSLITACFDVLFSALGYIMLLNITTALMLILILISVIIYFGFVKFKCSKCGTVFKGNKCEMFLAPHTPTKRKMFCPVCNEKMWCYDVFEKKVNDK